jgi:glycosyltransferase involved in cell wall biosynthesis
MQKEAGRLRVLMVAPRYTPHPQGGIAIHVYQVASRLVRAGVDLTVLATDISGKLPAIEESEGMKILRVRAWPANKDYYFAPGLYPIITRGQWDLVHCHGSNGLIPPVAMLAAWRANIPYILTLHSAGDVTHLRKALRGLYRRMLRPLILRAEKIIAVSEFEAAFFRERLRLPAERFAIISNGAGHLPEMPEETNGATNGANHSSLIVSIGRLERYKGHQRVIAALPKVLEQVPDAQLRIAGVGQYEPALQKLARKLDVADHVEIRPLPAGDWSGIASLIARADLVTLLSDYESQGIAVLEALSLRRPVLVTRTSALQEFAERGLARAVPLESTPAEVAAAVVDQLHQPLIPLKTELPTWDDCAAKLLALYLTVARSANVHPDEFKSYPPDVGGEAIQV